MTNTAAATQITPTSTQAGVPEVFANATVPPPEPDTSNTEEPDTPSGLAVSKLAGWAAAIGGPVGFGLLWAITPWLAIGGAAGASLLGLTWWSRSRRKPRRKRPLRLSWSRTVHRRGNTEGGTAPGGQRSLGSRVSSTAARRWFGGARPAGAGSGGGGSRGGGGASPGGSRGGLGRLLGRSGGSGAAGSRGAAGAGARRLGGLTRALGRGGGGKSGAVGGGTGRRSGAGHSGGTAGGTAAGASSGGGRAGARRALGGALKRGGSGKAAGSAQGAGAAGRSVGGRRLGFGSSRKGGTGGAKGGSGSGTTGSGRRGLGRLTSRFGKSGAGSRGGAAGGSSRRGGAATGRTSTPRARSGFPGLSRARGATAGGSGSRGRGSGTTSAGRKPGGVAGRLRTQLAGGSAGRRSGAGRSRAVVAGKAATGPRAGRAGVAGRVPGVNRVSRMVKAGTSRMRTKPKAATGTSAAKTGAPSVGTSRFGQLLPRTPQQSGSRRAQQGGVSGSGSPGRVQPARGAARRMGRLFTRQRTWTTAPQRTTTHTHPRNADPGRPSSVASGSLDFDDAGFPAHIPSALVETPAQSVGDDLGFDDAGFPIYHAPESSPAPDTQEGRPAMTAPTNAADAQAVEAHAQMIDHSTPHTKITTATAAADSARRSGQDYYNQAETLRSQAAHLQDKEGMADTANSLLAEAARAEETGNQRMGMAAAYDDWAAQIAAQNGAGQQRTTVAS